MKSLIARLNHIRFSWLDFKVGFRMLARDPGLTVVGTLAMAVAIAVGTIYFEAVNKWQNPRLPIEDGDRVISIISWDVSAVAAEAQSLYDFAIWRDQARTVTHLGAAMPFMRNLVTEDRRVEPIRGAEITASAFQLMGTAPIMGRPLTASDEEPGEAPVVVIGHALWRTRFAGDPDVLGRTVQVGTTAATIVGVMPEGFAFPVSQQIWTPLRVDGSALEPRTGPGVSIFGRLASGASIEDAQTEIGALMARTAADNPETHRNLRPQITQYGKPLDEGPEALIRNILYVVNGIFLMLLAVVCVNVATLVFARTATRGWEITVRNALGASRGRIVMQLFVEALVLAGIAAVLGLVAARFALGWGLSMMGGGELPFWIDDSLSLKTVGYTALLAVFGAAIVGILPALRVTRINVQDALRSESAARSGLKFGGVWTTAIVLQIAITVAFLPLAAGGVFESNRFRQRAEGIGAENYLTASIGIDREDHALDSAAFAARARSSVDELARRLQSEPGVDRVTFADRLPLEDQFKYRIEVDSMPGSPHNGSAREHAGTGISRLLRCVRHVGHCRS